MRINILILVCVLSVGSFRLWAANNVDNKINYEMTDLGKQSLEYLQNHPEVSFVSSGLSALGSIFLGAGTAASTALLCHYFPDDIGCSFGGSMMAITGSLATIYTSVASVLCVIKPTLSAHKDHELFIQKAAIIKEAYLYINKKSTDIKKTTSFPLLANRRAHQNLLEITFDHFTKINPHLGINLSAFAKKIIRANEAGYFVPSSAFINPAIKNLHETPDLTVYVNKLSHIGSLSDIDINTGLQKYNLEYTINKIIEDCGIEQNLSDFRIAIGNYNDATQKYISQIQQTFDLST